MVGLLIIGFVAGLIAGISPCILPVLPVILFAGATSPEAKEGKLSKRSLRPYAVIVGLIVSFSIFTLVGSALLSALGLPQDFLRDAGLVVIGVLGVSLIIPGIGHVLERPFARLQVRQFNGSANGFVLGLGLGAVFVPCAGPVLAAITVIGATHHINFTGVLLTLAFAIGAAVPMLIVVFAGGELAERVKALRERAPIVRVVGGVVLIAMTFAIAFNATDGLQRFVPGYTNTLQNHVENTAFAKQHLDALKGTATTGALASCIPSDPVLQSCGNAPDFKGIVAWLNTKDNNPILMSSLRGHVVLVDFWTYSCINCQRSLPHVEAWYARYHKVGFDVIGVSTPEFAFEHVASNVLAASHQLGVKYPVAIDNNYATWDAYDNEYWPAEYLIDARGVIRHVEFGEGNYTLTESLLRRLLVGANPAVHLPPATDVPDKTPVVPLTPESYLGYDRIENLLGLTTPPTINEPQTFRFPSALPLNDLGMSGAWTFHSEEITAGSHADLELHFEAQDVYLVLSGKGTLTVTDGRSRARSINVAGIPRLYTLVSGSAEQEAILKITATPGVEAYDFTFG
jgi:cytochrome c biogenesis protein CcdA/thiol-disulfide isomerase/thioredoxin